MLSDLAIHRMRKLFRKGTNNRGSIDKHNLSVILTEIYEVGLKKALTYINKWYKRDIILQTSYLELKNQQNVYINENKDIENNLKTIYSKYEDETNKKMCDIRVLRSNKILYILFIIIIMLFEFPMNWESLKNIANAKVQSSMFALCVGISFAILASGHFVGLFKRNMIINQPKYYERYTDYIDNLERMVHRLIWALTILRIYFCFAATAAEIQSYVEKIMEEIVIKNIYIQAIVKFFAELIITILWPFLQNNKLEVIGSATLLFAASYLFYYLTMIYSWKLETPYSNEVFINDIQLRRNNEKLLQLNPELKTLELSIRKNRITALKEINQIQQEIFKAQKHYLASASQSTDNLDGSFDQNSHTNLDDNIIIKKFKESLEDESIFREGSGESAAK